LQQILKNDPKIQKSKNPKIQKQISMNEFPELRFKVVASLHFWGVSTIKTYLTT
jgi:uncharacterized protein YggL (DUF469 family)